MLFLDNSYQKEFECKIVNINNNQIILNQTIFYAKSGGQPGDTGTLSDNENNINIVDTIYDVEKNIVHITENDINFDINEKVKGRINWKTRYKHMRMHTALHLLCSIIPFDVTGGQIGYNKSRLDFDLQDNIINKDEIQNKVNKLVKENYKIDYHWISLEELDKQPELVRTMSVKPPRVNERIRLVKIGDIDIQPCGGTHVKRTSEIGEIIVQKIENKGKKNRRIIISLN